MESITTAIGCCSLKRSRRRTLSISVLPNGSVEVIAPLDAALSEIQRKIEKRSGWISRQRRFFSTLRLERPERRYCTGATHRYLGRQYRLIVTTADHSDVKLRGAYLHVHTRSASGRAVAVLVSGWIRERAKEQFERRLKNWLTWCVERRLPEPKLHLLDMPKRWGSAHRNGRISLNPELVRAPSSCIDYVIAHEICHIKHPQHDKEFYAQLEKLCPRWRAIKQRLETSDL